MALSWFMLCYNKSMQALSMSISPLRTLFTASATLRFGAVALLLSLLWLAILWAIALP